MTNANDLVQFSLDSSLANGLTKREYFAAMAMQGILANNIRYGDFDECAKQSVMYSDALIESLNKTKN